MKPIKFITTFSKTGYDVYGKKWLETFTKNITDSNVSADIYIDFILPKQKQINFLDYDKVIPNHKKWLNDFEEKYDGAYYNKKMAKRFSYKSFVVQHALKNNTGCYLIWLDGDCIFKPNQDFSDFPKDLLDNKFIAVQREHNGGDDHCESGIVIFDTDHEDKEIFLNQLTDYYKIDNIIKMHSPYDGFIIYKSLSGIEYTDLNEEYGKRGIQSDPNETFLHPEISKRFFHNIGVTGKSNYDDFSKYADSDEYFKLILHTVQLPEVDIAAERLKLINMRKAKYEAN